MSCVDILCHDRKRMWAMWIFCVVTEEVMWTVWTFCVVTEEVMWTVDILCCD